MDSKEATAILREHSDRLAKWVGPQGDEERYKRYSQAFAAGAEVLELLAFADKIGPTLGADESKHLIRDAQWNSRQYRTFSDALRAGVRVVEERKDELNA